MSHRFDPPSVHVQEEARWEEAHESSCTHERAWFSSQERSFDRSRCRGGENTHFYVRVETGDRKGGFDFASHSAGNVGRLSAFKIQIGNVFGAYYGENVLRFWIVGVHAGFDAGEQDSFGF